MTFKDIWYRPRPACGLLKKLTRSRSRMPDAILIGRRRTSKRGKRHSPTPPIFIRSDQLQQLCSTIIVLEATLGVLLELIASLALKLAF